MGKFIDKAAEGQRAVDDYMEQVRELAQRRTYVRGDEYRCELCGRMTPAWDGSQDQEFFVTIDYIFDFAALAQKYGEFIGMQQYESLDNVEVICSICNKYKHGGHLGLFPPRWMR
ncbi:MAG TPA: hypothetical protein VMS37_22960 [Verrucomicrobiae bacterium]|nr:hypothetical protein [Verrucomicrobiae bacterium]